MQKSNNDPIINTEKNVNFISSERKQNYLFFSELHKLAEATSKGRLQKIHNHLLQTSYYKSGI